VATTPHSLFAGTEEGRAFLQERLAFLGKVICLIVVGFYLVGNVAAILLPYFEWTSWVAHGSNRLMLASIVVSAAVWRFCRGPARPLRVLEAVDAGSLLLLCGLFAMLALFPFTADSDGEVVSRSLLAIVMMLVSRAVIVPILLPEYGATADVAKVVDFGLVKSSREEPSSPATTRSRERPSTSPRRRSGLPISWTRAATSTRWERSGISWSRARPSSRDGMRSRCAATTCTPHPSLPPSDWGRPSPPSSQRSCWTASRRARAGGPRAPGTSSPVSTPATTFPPGREEEARLWWRQHPPAEVRDSRRASPGSSVLTLSALMSGRGENGVR
jgi:hypothetical protein